MQAINRAFLLSLPFLIVSASCGSDGSKGGEAPSENDEETVMLGTVSEGLSSSAEDEKLLLPNMPYNSTILVDADGDINGCYFNSLYDKKLGLKEMLDFRYQRVGCSEDTCKQEFVTLSAVQYPVDSIRQNWMKNILGRYYYDVTRVLDIQVNGIKTSDNGEGEIVTENVGCKPYEGDLSDNGKTMFDYYQARVWVIGSKREADEHGPAGRFVNAIYHCWQSKEVSSWFVAYSTIEPQRSVHYLTSFDRRDGHLLTLTDILIEDYMAEFNDLLEEAARTRYYQLKNKKSNRIALVDDNDYSMGIQVTNVAFTQDGLAVSTGALPFDQWPSATHILIIPYEKINSLLLGRFRK